MAAAVKDFELYGIEWAEVGGVVTLKALDGFDAGVAGEMREVSAGAVSDVGEEKDSGREIFGRAGGSQREQESANLPGAHSRRQNYDNSDDEGLFGAGISKLKLDSSCRKQLFPIRM
jgi:hypothetical protein